MKILPYLFFLFAATYHTSAQKLAYPKVTAMLDHGRIAIKESNAMGTISNNEWYQSVLDSTYAILEKDSNDTQGLFTLALLKSQKYLLPSGGRSDERLANLQEAAGAIERAMDDGMDNLTVKVLRARTYNQMKGCFVSDQSWMYEDNELRRKRKTLFERYQRLANEYYAELKELDPPSAWEYQKMIKEDKYPLEVK